METPRSMIFLSLPVNLFHQSVAHIQYIYRTVIKLLPPCCNCKLFGSPKDQLGVQLLFQGTDVRTNGWLGKIKMFGSLRKAIIFHYCYKGFQLFEFHRCPFREALKIKDLFQRPYAEVNFIICVLGTKGKADGAGRGMCPVFCGRLVHSEAPLLS